MCVCLGPPPAGRRRIKSDIDLLIDLEPGRSLMDHADLVVELERLLGRRVDVVIERRLEREAVIGVPGLLGDIERVLADGDQQALTNWRRKSCE
jgi:predicted nucleotidyltransferase